MLNSSPKISTNQAKRNLVLDIAGEPAGAFLTAEGSSQDSILDKTVVLKHFQTTLGQLSTDADTVVKAGHPENNLIHRLAGCLRGVFPDAASTASSADLLKALEYWCEPKRDSHGNSPPSQTLEQSNQRSLIRRVIRATERIEKTLFDIFHQCGSEGGGIFLIDEVVEARRYTASETLRRELVAPLALTLIQCGNLSGNEAVPIGIRLSAIDEVGRAYATFYELAALAGALKSDFEDNPSKATHVEDYQSFLRHRFDTFQPIVAELVEGYLETISSQHLSSALRLEEFKLFAEQYREGQDVADFILTLSRNGAAYQRDCGTLESVVFGSEIMFPQPSPIDSDADFDGVRLCIKAWNLVSEFNGLLPALLEIRANRNS